jgi:hypothetical protein
MCCQACTGCCTAQHSTADTCQTCTRGLLLQSQYNCEQMCFIFSGVYKGVTTSELDELAAETAASLTATHPDYAVLAARIAISNLHKSTLKSFSSTVTQLYEHVNPKTGACLPACASLGTLVIATIGWSSTQTESDGFRLTQIHFIPAYEQLPVVPGLGSFPVCAEVLCFW